MDEETKDMRERQGKNKGKKRDYRSANAITTRREVKR